MTQDTPTPGTNGRHTPDVSALREQYRLARAQAKLAQAKAEAQMWEAFGDYAPNWSDLADPFAVRRDDFGQVWLPLGAGNMRGRQGGRNIPFAWTDFDLDRMRSLSRWLAVKNDLAIGALRALRNFTIKRGYKWEVRAAKGYERNRDALKLVPMVQRLIDTHADINGLPSRERSACTRAVRDGEVFVRHFCQDDGSTVVRFVEPEQVRERAGLDANCAFGIETDPYDIETPLAYWISYDGEEYDRVCASEVSHLKRNVDECVKRGLSDFYSSGESLDGVFRLLRNMREAGAVQAAIAWIEQFESSSASQVSAHIAGIKDLNRPQIQRPEAGRNIDYQKFEPGSIVKVSKGKNYLPAPLAGNTSNHTAIVQACLRALGCRWNMPEYLISGDSSNANYSSTLVSGSPFVNSIECEQDDFGTFFLRWRWIAVRNACEKGLLPVPISHVMAMLDIHYTAPQVAVANEAEQAEIDHKDIAAGVMSIQTRRGRRGLDDAQERNNLQEEPPKGKEQPQQPQQPGMPGMPGEGEGEEQQQESLHEDHDDAEVSEEVTFDDSKHPRAKDGKFGSGSGSGGGKSKEGKKSDEKGGKPSEQDSPKTNNSTGGDVAAGRPSKPEERRKNEDGSMPLPPAKEWKDPPPKVGKKGEGMKARPTGDQSQTKIGDLGEELATKIGFRSILPPGQRSHKAGENEEKGSTIDLEYDHSGRAYELKLCNSSATEYRLKAKAKEKAGKEKFAGLHDLTAHVLVGVRDVDSGEVHFYAGRESGLIGSEVSSKHYDYVGSVKP